MQSLGLVGPCREHRLHDDHRDANCSGYSLVPHAEGLLVGVIVKWLREKYQPERIEFTYDIYAEATAELLVWRGGIVLANGIGSTEEEACLAVLEGITN